MNSQPWSSDEVKRQDDARRQRAKSFKEQFADDDSPCGYAVNGLFLAGQTGLVCAPEKGGKTTLMEAMCAAKLADAPFLGMPASKSPTDNIAVLTFETPPDHFQGRVADALTRQHDVEEETAWDWSLGKMFVSSRTALLTDEGERVRFARYLEDSRTKICIIDPLYAVLPTDQMSSVVAMGKAIQSLVRSIIKVGCTPILVHHTREIPVGHVPTLYDSSGAGVSTIARSWILLNRMTPYAGDKTHDLVAVHGTSEGDYGKLRVRVDEKRMAIEVHPFDGVPQKDSSSDLATVVPFLRRKEAKHGR